MRQNIAEGFFLKESKHPFVFENTQGHVFKVTIVNSNVFRMQHQIHSLVIETDTNAPFKDYSIKEENENSIEIETPNVRLIVTLKPAFQLCWYKNDSQSPFAQDLAYRSYGYDKTSGAIWHYQVRPNDNTYYGLGERSGSLDLTGRRFRLERLDCMGYDAQASDPLYKFCPFYIGLSGTSKEAYGIYYNNFSSTLFDLGNEIDAMWGPYTYYQSESGSLDYYMIYGPSVSSVIQSYSFITGLPRHLPPRYSFGYLASSMGYTEADNAQEKIKEFADMCQAHSIPCDGIHLSSGYTMNEHGDRCVFTWNTKRFPNPKKLAKTLKSKGFKIFANVKPWLLQQIHPDFDQLCQDKGLIWNNETNEPNTVMQWRGGRNTMGKASYIDFTSKAGYEYWKSHIKSQLLEKGYLVWLDNNEFTLPDDSLVFACEVLPDKYLNLLPSEANSISGPSIIASQDKTQLKEIGTTLQTLLMAQSSYEALVEHEPTKRPFLISRSAVPYCNQLVSQTWSGDNTTAWKTIQYNVSMGLGASLCNMPAGYGHDIGGFAGPKPDPEMFVRWTQQGIFWPRFCIHSWNTDGSTTEPWMYPEVLPTIRACIQFRYRLIPYLYSLYVKHVYQKGEPLIRPVLYDHQYDTLTYQQGFEFMLGPSVLVAPIFEPDLKTRKVYLPSQSAWYHYQTGEYYNCTKGQWVHVPAPITDEATPFFVKAGSMLSFGKVMNNVHAIPDNERRIQIFPEKYVNGIEAIKRTFVLYEDDGDTLYHETGRAYAEIHITLESNETELRVGLDIINDGYFPDYDTVWVTCPIASETRKLVFEGQDDQDELPKIVDDETMHVYTGLKIRMDRYESVDK